MSYGVVTERGKVFLDFLYVGICVAFLFHLSMQLCFHSFVELILF